jgi:hypothetical protein
MVLPAAAAIGGGVSFAVASFRSFLSSGGAVGCGDIRGVMADLGDRGEGDLIALAVGMGESRAPLAAGANGFRPLDEKGPV